MTGGGETGGGPETLEVLLGLLLRRPGPLLQPADATRAVHGQATTPAASRAVPVRVRAQIELGRARPAARAAAKVAGRGPPGRGPRSAVRVGRRPRGHRPAAGPRRGLPSAPRPRPGGRPGEPGRHRPVGPTRTTPGRAREPSDRTSSPARSSTSAARGPRPSPGRRDVRRRGPPGRPRSARTAARRACRTRWSLAGCVRGVHRFAPPVERRPGGRAEQAGGPERIERLPQPWPGRTRTARPSSSFVQRRAPTLKALSTARSAGPADRDGPRLSGSPLLSDRSGVVGEPAALDRCPLRRHAASSRSTNSGMPSASATRASTKRSSGGDAEGDGGPARRPRRAPRGPSYRTGPGRRGRHRASPRADVRR